MEDDRGASGAAFELPQLDRVREVARGGACDVLVVRELDRLSRSLAKQLFVEEELKRCGVEIEYVLDQYANSPEGSLMKKTSPTGAETSNCRNFSANVVSVISTSADTPTVMPAIW
jgi:site-specific DNA recombinase